MLSRSFTDDDNPRAWFRGIEHLRDRLTKYYTENEIDFSASEVVSWDKIASRMIEKLPVQYSPYILQIRIGNQNYNRLLKKDGNKIVDKNGNDVELNSLNGIHIMYDHLKETLVTIYDQLTKQWASDPCCRVRKCGVE